MADALDSKSSMGNHVWVQLPPPVLLSAQGVRVFRNACPFVPFLGQMLPKVLPAAGLLPAAAPWLAHKSAPISSAVNET